MILNFENPILTHECNLCGANQTVDITPFESTYLEEFGEYSNLQIICQACGAIEVFNMNLPTSISDEQRANDPQIDYILEIAEIIKVPRQ